MRRLIVNADDFGRSPQVNAAVIHAHRCGILTSASLMVAEPGAEEAALLARECPDLDVGLHVVACNGRSVLPARQIRGLVDDSGRFLPGEAHAGLRYALRPGLRRALRDEFRAQIERHLALMGYLHHLNGHHNLHLHPTLAGILIDLAAEYRVPCLRLVREPVLTSLSISRDHSLRKLRDHILFRWLSGRAERRMRSRGVTGNDCVFGFHQTGRLSEPYVLKVLERLPDESTTELYLHPAMEAAGAPPMWPSQSVETALLTSPVVRRTIEERGISLITYRELAGRQVVERGKSASSAGRLPV